MTLAEFREKFLTYRDGVDETSVREKNSQAAVLALERAYAQLGMDERGFADIVISEWITSDDGRLRFDALALVSTFAIKASVSALSQLRARLQGATGPSAHHELRKVDVLMNRLVVGDSSHRGSSDA